MRKRNFDRWLKKGVIGLFVVMLTVQPAFAAVKTTDKSELTGPGVEKNLTADAETPEAVYNKEMGMYEHEFAGGRRIVSSVANGGQVCDAVSLSVPKSSKVKLELDGQACTFENGKLLSQAGFYVMIVTDKDLGTGEEVSAIFRFRILNPPNGRIDNGEYPYPKVVSGLEKTSVTSGAMSFFALQNKKGFFTDIPEEGASVSEAVFYFPPNIGYQLFKDGAQVAVYSNMAVRDPGNYQLKLYAGSQAKEGNYAAYYEAFFQFTIPDQEEAAISAEVLEAGTGEQIVYQSDVLDEIYHEDLKLYEEVFDNSNVFYSNVGNGDIVGGGVYLDIPQNISVKMTVDGAEKPYQNKTVYDEEGTYYFTLSYQVQTKDTKTIYQSNFRFRIQKNAPAIQAADETPVLPSEEFPIEDGIPEETEIAVTEPLPEEELPAPEEEPVLSNEITPLETTAAPAGQGYDADLQLYSYTFSDGSQFLSAVPQNGLSNTEVYLGLPEGGSGKIYVGENSADLPEAVSVNEDGIYHAEITSAGGETLSWDFRVMSRAVSDLTTLQAPDGYYIASIVKDGVPVEGAAYAESYELLSDGTYTVSFLSYYEGYPECFLAIALDTQAPTLQFTGLDENGTATGKTVGYSANEENVTVVVTKGKKTVRTYNNTISGSGSFIVTATDPAGNQTAYEIKIPYKADKMTVILIIVVWLMAVGFIVYYKVNARRIKVR